jgi:hypothetical protein
VARIDLEFVTSGTYHYVESDRPSRSIVHAPCFRLRTLIHIGNDCQESFRAGLDGFPAYIDTGAALTLFPESCWRDYEASISRLEFDPAYLEQLQREHANDPTIPPRPVVTVGGNRHPYFLGRVRVLVADR